MRTHAPYSTLRRRRTKWVLGASICVWLSVLMAAWSYLLLHDLTPTRLSSHFTIANWPSNSAINIDDRRPTLLLFLHPKCPCSRATLRQLERIFTSSPRSKAKLIVVATVPQFATGDWFSTNSIALAKRLPNADLYFDHGGREAVRFGATSSGHLMLFDAGGQCVFAGGVTPSRGHEGSNVGADHLAALLAGNGSSYISNQTFGCRLCLPTDTAVATATSSKTDSLVQQP